MSSSHLAVALVVAFRGCLCAVPFAKKIAQFFRVVAARSPRSKSSGLTPLLGGIAIVGAALAAIMLTGSAAFWMVTGSLTLLLVGILDDVLSLNPGQKLAVCVIVAGATAILGPHLSLTGWRLVDVTIEIFWLVATTNAFNLIDGLDGLASGIGITSALAIAAVALTYRDQVLAIWSLALAGSLAGFLIL